MQCPHCGAGLKDEHPRFCAACGKGIPAPAPSAAAPAAPGLLAPGQEEVYFDGQPAAIRSLGGALVALFTLGVAWLVWAIRARSIHYRVTSQRIVIETGLFSKKLEQVDLYRVVDFVVERPFFQRMLGTGNLVVETLDKTQREVRIEGIRADVVALYERMRAATQEEKRRRGVALVDMEHQ